MGKFIVSSLCYQFLSIIFHSLCLSGLIWQVAQISMNYFKYETIKDINVIMPEEVKDADRVLNLCFENDAILDTDKYVDLLTRTPKLAYLLPRKDEKLQKRNFLSMIRVRERFDITKENILMKKPFTSTPTPVTFIIGLMFCYQVALADAEGAKGKGNVPISHNDLSDATELYVSFSSSLPYFDYQRLQTLTNFIGVKKDGAWEKVDYDARSFFYVTNRLEWPYSDECVDYVERYGYADRLNAIADYDNIARIEEEKSLSKYKVFTKNDTMFLNASVLLKMQFTLDGASVYDKMDCHRKAYFTVVDRVVSYKDVKPMPVLNIGATKSADPSFIIESKPRIDDIDFVTYIFGALGTWIGFSFLALNPVPYVVRVNEGPSPENNNQTNQVMSEGPSLELNRLKNRISTLEREKIVIKSESRKQKIDIEAVRNEVMRLKNRMSDIESKMLPDW